MSDPLATGFAPASLQQWEALVRAKAGADAPLTTTIEQGVEVKWLYTATDALGRDPGGFPGAAPFVRGTRVGEPWAIRQEIGAQTRTAANVQILEDLEGGATDVLLRTDPDGAAGIPVGGVEELDELLTGVQLDLAPVALEAGQDAVRVAALLCELWRRRGHAPAEVRGSLRLDPIGTLARLGAGAEQLEGALTDAVAVLAGVRAEFPLVQALAADTTAYVDAGADATFELALALATGIAYLRAGELAEIAPEVVAAGLEFTLVAGPDQFLEIAKLRAVRRLWATVLQHCGVSLAERRSPVYVRTSWRMISALDPWNNLLRATTAAFAAGVGGADGVTVLPFDEPVDEPGPLGRRMARNTQLVLIEEAFLGRVADPGGGSWYVESLTDQLAQSAWSMLQELEREGGIIPAVASGKVAERLEAATADRHQALARRKRVLTGVNTFPLLGDDGLERAEPVTNRTAGSRTGSSAPATGKHPLTPARDAAPFEALRARAVALARSSGREPAILLACMGSLAAHTATALWAKGFFEAGGITTVTSGPQPDAAAQAALLREHELVAAAVCPGRGIEAEQQAQLVEALREAGARTVYLVGVDAPTAASAGADAGVREGVDMVTVLGGLLDRLAGSTTEASGRSART